MTIGEMIRAKRKACGISMAELGRRIGVTAAAISRYELGQRELTLDTIQTIADALNVHIFDLLGIGEKLRSFQIECLDIQPISGNPDDMSQEKISKLLSASVDEIYDGISADQKREFWNLLIEGGGIPKFNPNPIRSHIDTILDKMNKEGQQKVADYAEDILPRYRREEAPPEGTPGKDTPMAESPTEGA